MTCISEEIKTRKENKPYILIKENKKCFWNVCWGQSWAPVKHSDGSLWSDIIDPIILYNPGTYVVSCQLNTSIWNNGFKKKCETKIYVTFEVPVSTQMC